MTNMSLRGILLNMLSDAHSNVPITTINITPTSAAIGICSINGARNRTNSNRQTAAVIPDKRPRPPEFTLINDCPIIAQPPMPPNIPQTRFATPCPIHSRLPLPRVSVISSIKVSVIRDSISPTPQSTIANGKMMTSVFQLSGTISYCMKKSCGRPPLILPASADDSAPLVSAMSVPAMSVPAETNSVVDAVA